MKPSDADLKGKPTDRDSMNSVADLKSTFGLKKSFNNDMTDTLRDSIISEEDQEQKINESTSSSENRVSQPYYKQCKNAKFY